MLYFKRPRGLTSRGGGVAVYVFDINQPSLPTPFNSVLVPVSVYMALSFHKFSRQLSVFSLFFSSYLCLIGPFNYMSLHESPSALI